jgi:hypothetical protein
VKPSNCVRLNNPVQETRSSTDHTSVEFSDPNDRYLAPLQRRSGSALLRSITMRSHPPLNMPKE